MPRLSAIVSSAAKKTEEQVKSSEGPKPVIHGVVEHDGQVASIMIPLHLDESHLRITQAGTVVNGIAAKNNKANACVVFRTPKDLEIAVRMQTFDENDMPTGFTGEVRHYLIKQQAGPTVDRYLNLLFNPDEFYTVPGETVDAEGKIVSAETAQASE